MVRDQAAYLRNRYGKAGSAGVCTRCLKAEPRANLKTCSACAEKLSQINKRHYQKRKVTVITAEEWDMMGGPVDAQIERDVRYILSQETHEETQDAYDDLMVSYYSEEG